MPGLMSAPSVTVRPNASRIMAIASGLCLIAMTVAVTVALPAEIRAVFTPFQVLTLAACLGVVLALLWGVARCRVSVDDDGVTVLNGFRSHHLAWSQIKGVSYKDGAPWPTLGTHDGEKIQLFAIQAADGPRGDAAVERIRAKSG